MTEETADQSFEDAFDELASEDASEDFESAEESTEGEEYVEVQEQGEEEEALRTLEPEAEQESEPQVAEEPDPLTAARKEAQLWQHKYNSDLGRQNAFQRKVNEQQDYIKQLESQMQRSSPTDMTPAEWKAVQDDYPDIAQGVQAQFASLEARHQAEVAAIRNELKPMQEQAADAYVQSQFQILSNQHPDYAEIAQSPEFGAWVASQPNNVQSMIESTDAGEAAYLIQTYKNSLAPVQPANTELKQRRDKQLQQAQTIPKRGGRTVSNLPPDDDFEAAFDFYADR